ncbi:hypothetical protein DPMN_127295 [Dreissena polymorpha]|uniref:Uncharacterized protein n=1 Tax=Dreissena polymorpha TaxID=45954 RepID=A0A9D4H107_DREPO|nr:hypothetical protein DPMN_127295 [Dreissena polymorpha]
MPDKGPRPSLEYLTGIARDLIFNSTFNKTINTYSVALKKLCEFRELYNLHKRWSVLDQELLNFITYLATQKMPATTVTTYISGIAYAHNLKQVNETIKSFIVVKALEGLRRKTGELRQTYEPQ